MSEQLRESLSALMDGEASAFEVRRLLDEMERAAELRETWVRWQRVSATLQAGSAASRTDLADRVWASLDGGEAGSAPAAKPPRHRQRSARRLAAWAGAAAAAVLAVIGANWVIPGDGEAPAPQVAVRPVAPPPARAWPDEAPLERRRVNAYMLQHMQHKAVNHPDVGAFTKLVTFEPEPGR